MDAGVYFEYLSTQSTFYTSALCGVIGVLVTLLFIPDVSTLDMADMDDHWQHVKDNHAGLQRHTSMKRISSKRSVASKRSVSSKRSVVSAGRPAAAATGTAAAATAAPMDDDDDDDDASGSDDGGEFAAVVYRGDAVAKKNLSVYERVVKRAHVHHGGDSDGSESLAEGRQGLLTSVQGSVATQALAPV